MNTKKILYIRNFANEVKRDSYNLQEIGLGKALVRKGYDCDIVYYQTNNGERREVIYREGDNRLCLIWLKGIKFLSNSIYTRVLNKRFLDQYDYVVTTEYNQVMSYLLSWVCSNKLVLYHGPYLDNSHASVRKLYDQILLPRLRTQLKFSFVKSELARNYLINKGFKSVITLGVGLDEEVLSKRQNTNSALQQALESLQGKKVLLYLGVLEERRNILFLLQVFKRLLEHNNDYHLLIVGNGAQEDTDRYWRYIEDNQLVNAISHFQKVEQKDLWQVYEASQAMIFPTTYDIFGMVLLESMYYGVPIISSVNGGSSMLLEHNRNGIVIEQFEEQLWVEQIVRVIADSQFANNIAANAHETVKSVSWDRIVGTILNTITEEDGHVNESFIRS